MIDSAEALRIVYRGIETRRTEYKRSMPWEGQERLKLIRTIVGLANAGGGYLVLGYDEDKQGDDRFVGMKDDHLVNWDVTNVARDVNNYIQPDIDVEVTHPQSDDKNTTFVVVRVPPHGSLPHICVRDGGDDRSTILKRGALYCRNRNKEVTEISRLDDWRELVQRLTMSKKSEIQQLVVDALSCFDTNSLRVAIPIFKLDVETQAIEDHALNLRKDDITSFPLLAFAAVPVDKSQSQEIEKSKLSLKSACVDYRGWPFLFYLESSRCPPRFDEDSIWAVDTEPFFERPTFYYWQFKYTRSLFYSVQITPESSVGHGSDLDAYTQAKLLAEALIAVGRLYKGLGIPEDKPIEILLKYMSLSKARITVMGHSQLSHPYAGSQIVLQNTIHLNELLMRPWSWAGELVSKVGRRMGVRRSLPMDYMEALAKKHLSGGQKLYD